MILDGLVRSAASIQRLRPTLSPIWSQSIEGCVNSIVFKSLAMSILCLKSIGTAGRFILPSQSPPRGTPIRGPKGYIPPFAAPGFDAISSVIMKPFVPLNSYCLSPARQASTVLGMSTKPSL